MPIYDELRNRGTNGCSSVSDNRKAEDLGHATVIMLAIVYHHVVVVVRIPRYTGCASREGPQAELVILPCHTSVTEVYRYTVHGAK